MRKRLLTLSVVLSSFTAMLLGCGSERELTIGMVPSGDPEAMLERFRPIEQYLERELDLPVNVVVTGHYAGLIERMKGDEIDIGWFGAFTYIAAQEEAALEPMVIQQREGYGLYYHSLIITRTDSGIDSIEGLRSADFAFVDPGSTSGFVIPYALFKSRDVDYETYFTSHWFSGTHDDVLNDVLTGKADAGVMEDLTLSARIAEGAVAPTEIRTLWTSEPIPGSPFAARADLSPSLKSGFLGAMTRIHEADPEAMKSFDRRIEAFLPFHDDLYTDIRNISTILGRQYIIDNFLQN